MTNKPDPEVERLMRLRDKQISARDPLVKERKFDRMAAERERKRDKSISLMEFWTAIPQALRSGFFGLLVGLALLKIVTGLWDSPLAMPNWNWKLRRQLQKHRRRLATLSQS